jgi:hypothetical protein
MTRAEAVRRLDALDAKDPEVAHSDADGILLALVGADVRAAYQRLVERAKWWAHA